VFVSGIVLASEYRKIAIIGGSGAGKSTLALQVGKALALEVHHIDSMFWCNGWEVRDKAEFLAKVEDVLAKDSWIFDGFPKECWATHAATLDMLIFVDTPYFQRFWRVVKRSYKQGQNGPPGRSGLAYVMLRKKFVYNWLFGAHRHARQRCNRNFKNAGGNMVKVRLEGAKSVNKFLAELEAGVVRQ